MLAGSHKVEIKSHRDFFMSGLFRPIDAQASIMEFTNNQQFGTYALLGFRMNRLLKDPSIQVIAAQLALYRVEDPSVPTTPVTGRVTIEYVPGPEIFSETLHGTAANLVAVDTITLSAPSTSFPEQTLWPPPDMDNSDGVIAARFDVLTAVWAAMERKADPSELYLKVTVDSELRSIPLQLARQSFHSEYLQPRLDVFVACSKGRVFDDITDTCIDPCPQEPKIEFGDIESLTVGDNLVVRGFFANEQMRAQCQFWYKGKQYSSTKPRLQKSSTEINCIVPPRGNDVPVGAIVQVSVAVWNEYIPEYLDVCFSGEPTSENYAQMQYLKTEVACSDRNRPNTLKLVDGSGEIELDTETVIIAATRDGASIDSKEEVYAACSLWRENGPANLKEAKPLYYNKPAFINAKGHIICPVRK